MMTGASINGLTLEGPERLVALSFVPMLFPHGGNFEALARPGSRIAISVFVAGSSH